MEFYKYSTGNFVMRYKIIDKSLLIKFITYLDSLISIINYAIITL